MSLLIYPDISFATSVSLISSFEFTSSAALSCFLFFCFIVLVLLLIRLDHNYSLAYFFFFSDFSIWVRLDIEYYFLLLTLKMILFG